MGDNGPTTGPRWISLAHWLQLQAGSDTASEGGGGDGSQAGDAYGAAAEPSGTVTAQSSAPLALTRLRGHGARSSGVLPVLPDCRAAERLAGAAPAEPAVVLAAPGMPLDRAPVVALTQVH